MLSLCRHCSVAPGHRLCAKLQNQTCGACEHGGTTTPLLFSSSVSCLTRLAFFLTRRSSRSVFRYRTCLLPFCTKGCGIGVCRACWEVGLHYRTPRYMRGTEFASILFYLPPDVINGTVSLPLLARNKRLDWFGRLHHSVCCTIARTAGASSACTSKGIS